MRILLKVLGFSLVLILSFTGVTYVLPQMKGEAPVEKVLDVGALTLESFVALGEDLYEGKGTCTLCHNALGRAPDLLALNVEAISRERIADPEYRGTAKDAESYLRESMVDPGIYVVAGFGKKGTNDTESPMPAIDQPPAQLSAVEIDAIVAFLQDKDGSSVTVGLPTDVPESSTATQETTGLATTGLAQSPAEAIAKFACAACHSVLGTESPVGPDLNDIGARLSSDEIRTSIITPNAVIAEGFPPIMPDFSEKMMLAELEMIVSFLAQPSARTQGDPTGAETQP